MCVVAAAEELVCGAERPMDEEDAAAPVGGDRGRGPGGLGSPRSLRREAGVLGGGLPGQGRGLLPGHGASCLGTLLGPVPGLGRLRVSRGDEPDPRAPGSRLSDQAVPGLEAGPGAAATRGCQGCAVLGEQTSPGLGASIWGGALAACEERSPAGAYPSGPRGGLQLLQQGVTGALGLNSAQLRLI